MTHWERRARQVSEVYGAHVDWEERFYICPECGEPVYECDWEDDIGVLESWICPICEFGGDED